MEITRISGFEPNDDKRCVVCEQRPTVNYVTRGQTHRSRLCGACYFGEADMLDPEKWNGPQEVNK
jgi:hypothetical protein